MSDQFLKPGFSISFRNGKGESCTPRDVLSDTLGLGKLGTKVEAAGKIRVFAMVDAFTQWIMKPLHEVLFKFLRQIPQDGTFDQVAPVNLLIERLKTRQKRSVSVYSIDLSAATDRLPIDLQKILLKVFFSSLDLFSGLGTEGSRMAGYFAGLWATLLVGRDYWLKEVRMRPRQSKQV